LGDVLDDVTDLSVLRNIDRHELRPGAVEVFEILENLPELVFLPVGLLLLALLAH